MVLIPLPYGILPAELQGDTFGDTKCDLKIPHADIGERMATLLMGIEGVDASEARRIGTAIDENFNEVSRWAAYFLRNCICHCEEETPE